MMKSTQSTRKARNTAPVPRQQTGALAQAAHNSPATQSLLALQRMADQSAVVQKAAALQRMEEDELQGKFIQRVEEDELQMKPIQRMEEDELQMKPIQRMEEDELQMKPIQRMEEDELQGKFIQRAEAPKTNNTGLPDNLKSGIESLSGMSMDHVKVHRNSDKPAAVQAHAYAQGSDIHLGPGQEKHLPHEAWHVVQQAQGRVNPTMQMKGIAVNDDAGLEAEADVMGAKAMGLGEQHEVGQSDPAAGMAQLRASYPPQVLQQKINGSAFNMVGESHNKVSREQETEYLQKTYGIPPKNYWTEFEFLLDETNHEGKRKHADPPVAHVRQQVIGVASSLTFMLSEMEIARLSGSSKTPESVVKEMPQLFRLWEESITGGFLGVFMPGENKNDTARKNFALEPEEEKRLEEAAKPLMDVHEKLFYVNHLVSGGDFFIFSSRQEKIEKYFRELIPIMRNLDATMGGVKTDGQSSKEVSEGLVNERNVAMIYGASQAGRAGKTGVWKVGNVHINGLLPLEGGLQLGGSNVTLTPADEFSSELNKD